MGNKSQHVLAVTCMLIMCIMPVERVTKAENDVTPAPTVVISDLINVNTKEENTATIQKTSEEPTRRTELDEDNKLVVENSNGLNSESIPEFDGQPKKFGKGRTRHTPPVCKYTFTEIFLFGQEIDGVTAVDRTTNVTVEPAPASETIEIKVRPLETVDINDTEVKADEDVEEANMKLKVTDVHSFEEWKSLKLQEQESKLTDPEPGPSRTVRGKKTQVNYGSQDCGAKVLAHNKEAKHASALLDENRDLYMLNPCSNPIWFVIELCEPIQVQQVQIGNLELFSSAPKDFVVSVSERYPSREWHSIGTFEAANDKTIQSFNIKSNDVMFAKYIKFEMKSHFSNEHFCPLTLVRVMGISMVDEFDESEQQTSKSEGDDESNDDSPEILPENSLQPDDGAINAMLNMVKNAIGLNGNAQKKQEQSVLNADDRSLVENDTDSIDPTVESEITLVTNHTEIVNISEENSALVTLIQRGNGEDLSTYISNFTSYSPHIPLYVPQFLQYLSPVTKKLNAEVCWFLEFVCKVSLTGCLVHYPFNYSIFVPFSFASSSRNIEANIQKESIVNISDPANNLQDKFHHGVDTDIGNRSLEDATTIPLEVVAEDSTTIEHTPTVSTDRIDDQKSSETLPDADLVSDEPVKVKPCDSDEEKTAPVFELGSDRAQEPTDVVELSKSQNLSAVGGYVAEELSSTTTTDSAHENSKVIKTDTTSPSKQPADETVLEKQSFHPTVVINPVSPKDSVFMRLSNRIRVLEQNMSLSSDYLENLSRRYKEQMDEMQRAFNKTTSKLVATSRTANENDAKQTELLKKAEAEIEILKNQVQILSISHDQLNSKLVERHLCLIILEFMIFIAVFVTCLGRRIGHAQQNLEKSDDMIQHLKRVIRELEETRHNPKITGNGHCHTVPFENNNKTNPIAPNNQRQEKKKKKKVKRNISNGSATAEPPVSTNAKVELTHTVGVENIGTNRPCCEQEVWNSSQPGLKIPETYVKGRR